MFLNNFKRYRNTAIIICSLLTINTLNNSSDRFAVASADRAIALDNQNIYIAQNKDQDKASIEKLIDYSIKVYETEDINALMTLMHPNSPIKSETEEISKIAFSMYDLDHEYSNLEILELSDTEATIQMTQTTKKLSGSDFKDNRVTSIQTLRKHNGQWKFFDLLSVQNIEYLN